MTDQPEIAELWLARRPEYSLMEEPQRPYAGPPACVFGTEALGEGYLPCNLRGRAFRYERPDQYHPADHRAYYCLLHEAHAATIGMVPAEGDRGRRGWPTNEGASMSTGTTAAAQGEALRATVIVHSRRRGSWSTVDWWAINPSDPTVLVASGTIERVGGLERAEDRVRAAVRSSQPAVWEQIEEWVCEDYDRRFYAAPLPGDRECTVTLADGYGGLEERLVWAENEVLVDVAVSHRWPHLETRQVVATGRVIDW
jgi:hypothetical protein